MRDIKLEHIFKSYGDTAVLSDFSHTFPAGVRTCIMGPSGCGKTTLLRLLLGLETPDRGSITGLPARCSAVFQENRLFESFSALANLSAVCPDVPKQEWMHHLTALGLGDSMDKPARTLSGGMKRRVAIARAVLAPGELLVLDEPFTGLDQNTKNLVLAYLQTNTRNRTVLFVTHDAMERDALADHVLELRPVSPERK